MGEDRSVESTRVARILPLIAWPLTGRPPRSEGPAWQSEQLVVEDEVRSRLFGRTAIESRLARYVLLRRLGRGAFGEVWEARDPELDRIVAIKIARRQTRDPKASTRFLREAQSLAKLAHPNVVSVFDVAVAEEDADGFVAYFVMERLDRDLRAWLATPRAIGDVISVFLDAARGLAAAHAVGLVHRDFKPANVLIGEDGRARVADFGLALRRADLSTGDATEAGPATEQDDARLTAAGCVMGTPRYMAPEQHEDQEIDARADQFAFCVTLHEACYGTTPFSGATFGALAELKRSGRLPPVPASARVPAALRRVIERGLAPRADDRYPSMMALAEDLQALGRKRRRPHWRTAGALLAGLVITPVSVIALEREGPCLPLEQRAAEVWSPQRAALLADRVGESGVSYAPGQWAHARTALDAWSSEWHAQHTELCGAERAPTLPSRELTCLDEALGAMDALLRLLERVSAESVPFVGQAVAELPRPASCRVRSVPADSEPEPFDADVRAALDEVDALQATAQYEQVIAKTTPWVERAEELGDERLLAAALVRRGAALERRHDLERAAEDLERAYFAALEAESFHDAIVAASVLVLLHGWGNADIAEAQVWAGHARAALERRPDEAAEAGLASSEAVLHLNTGDFARAIERAHEALALHEVVGGPRSPGTASARNILANALFRSGRQAEGLQQIRQAVADLEATLGPYHPDVAMALGNLGTALGATGDYAQATALLEQAISVATTVRGHDDPMVIGYRGNLALARLQLGDAAGAATELEAVLEATLRRHGEQHPDVAHIHNNLGLALAAAERTDDGIAHLRRAAAIFEAIHGGEHPDLADTLMGLGDIWAHRGEFREAIDAYERAVRISSQARGPDDPLTIDLRSKLVDVSGRQANAPAN